MGHILPSSHPGSTRLCYNCTETHPYELTKGTASMSGLPSTEERKGDIFPFFSRYGAGAGYITLLIGYLFTILTTTHLNLPGSRNFPFSRVGNFTLPGGL